MHIHIKSEDTENTHTNLYGMQCKQSKKMWHTQISHTNKQIITNNSYTALSSNTCVKLTALYKQLDQNHIYIHFNKPDHSRHIYTPTHTQSIGTVTHGLPRPVKRPIQRVKSWARPQTQTEWVRLADIHPRFPTSWKSGPKNSMEQTLHPHMQMAQHTDKRHSPKLTFKFLACPRPSPKDVRTCHVERLSTPGTPPSPRWSYWHRQTGSWSRWRPRTWTACAAAPCCPGAVTACPGSKSTACRRWTLRSGCAHSASLPPSRNTQGAANTQTKKSLLVLDTKIRLDTEIILPPYRCHATHRVLQTSRKRRACICCTLRSDWGYILCPYHHQAIQGLLQTHRRRKRLLSLDTQIRLCAC